MKCNLTKLVRCIIIVVITVMCINIVVFLKSPQGQTTSVFDEVFLPVPRNFDGNRLQNRYASISVKLNSTTTCPGLQMLEPHQDGEFQAVNGRSMFIYSAYLDGNVVKIIALREVFPTNDPLMCQIWFRVKGQDPLFVTSAITESLPEDHGRKYMAAFVSCTIPAQLLNTTPHAVSLVIGDKCGVPTNILFLPGPAKMRSQFTVCVTPLNYRYSRAYELVEMIEMNKILGAQKFVFYNHSTGPNVDKVLEMYSQTDEVEVQPWHLPIKVDTWPPTGEPEVHYFAQIAALNDCLYRHRNRSKYLVYQDLDEFIIPYKHDNWEELVKERENLYGEASVFQFKCVFFRKEWTKPAKQFETEANKYKSVILSHTLRESEYLPYGTRSKYIINPRLTSLVGVHQVWRSSKYIDSVLGTDANLHHYRNWEQPNDPQPRVEDETAVNKYGSRLVDKLQEVWSKLEDVPMDINISTYGDHV